MGNTDYLFSMPSYLSGIASVFDIGATLTERNYSISPEVADRIAIENDFKAIGNDIEKAFKEFSKD
jgi:hypothetical protein